MTNLNYRLKTPVLKGFFFLGKLVCHQFCGEKRNTSKLSARVRFAVTHGAEGFNQGVNLPVNIKKKKTLFCVPINENNFQIQTTVIFWENSPHSTYLKTLYIHLLFRLLNEKCGTFGQLQYYANNFDDFFVSIFIVFIVFHRNRMNFLFIHSLWRRANALRPVSRNSGPEKPCIRKTPTPLFCKAGLFMCCNGNEK